MVCEVIVDVMNHQVNRPFDYLIPDNLSFVEVGSRVFVPFGPRKLLGFVVKIKEKSEFPNLRSIIRVLDVVPAINPELMEICQDMAKRTNSFLISTFFTVLPNAMRVNYQKKLRLLNSDINDILKPFFKKEIIELNENLYPYMSLIKEEINQGKMEILYDLKEKATIIEVKMLKLKAMCFEGLTKRQMDVVDYLLKGEASKKQVMDDLGVTSGVISKLIEKDIVLEYNQETYREIKSQMPYLNKRVDLNPEQQKCYEEIKSALNTSKSFLLHGVTGSGKTEVYLNIIEDVVNNGKEAIMLVPEISLTPQMVSRFKGRFGDRVAVLHSALSDGERYDEWRKIMRHEVKIVVGARSAIFAPFTNIGVIIIDEAHEASYKQEDSPRYDAKDIAKFRSNYHHAPLVLGSATPNVCDYYDALGEKLQLLEMKKRANNKPLPQAILVNMREELKNGNKSIFSHALHDLIDEALAKNEQIILLLNRRGHSSFVMCRSCGDTIKCPNCDVTLTYHLDHDYLKCHYCGYQRPNVSLCPSCNSKFIKYVGVGTEKIVEEINKAFPDARVLRMDQDTTTKKGSHEAILQSFGNHEADILVGTQMIAKGLDFPNVTVVGILMADLILKMPDYRSSEKTFDLISQVSGRAGRHEKEGHVVIQAYDSDHYSIQSATTNNYLGFYNSEMEIRKLLRYKPFCEMCSLILTGPSRADLYKEAKKIIMGLDQSIDVLGPSDCMISRINNRYRIQITLKYNQNIDDFLQSLNERYQGDISIIIDKQ